MRVRETSIGRREHGVVLIAALAAAIALGACGSDDFPNNPRPAAPIELTAAIDDDSVSLSPSEFGAGTVLITVSNQTDDATRLVLDGPDSVQSTEIPPSGTTILKTNLAEGSYEATAGAEIGIEPATITVGPERPNSSSELLQP